MQGIKLSKNSKIYILCPKGFRSGGPTLLHQFASSLLKNNFKQDITPLIFYYELDVKPDFDNAYAEYHIKQAERIIDSPENIIIGGEGITEIIYLYPKSQKIIWWLSVDNYIKNLSNTYSNFYHNKNYLSPLRLKFNFTDTRTVFHWVQSRYALDFLRINDVPEERITYVSDYLHPVFLKKAKNVDIDKKEQIIAYNPNKGLEFTQKLINSAKNLKFIPIQNMTPEEVENLLARAMVYIDFGNHPGKDRIPREAAISSCTVITGKQGSAANDEDIPIDAEFKFDDTDDEIPNIIKKIEEIFADFPKYNAKFEKYRKIILSEPEKFEKDVIAALNLKVNKNFTKITFLQSGARGKFLKEITAKDNNLKVVFRLGGEGNEGLDEIEQISFDDAAFLYQEGRIEKFMAVVINENEKEHILRNLAEKGIIENDIIFIEIKK